MEIRLKEFKKEETKTFSVELPSATAPIVVQEQRPPSTTTKTQTTGTGTTQKKTTTVKDVAEHAKELAKGIAEKTGGAVGEAITTIGTAGKILSVAKKALDATGREPTTVKKTFTKTLSKTLITKR